MMKSDAARPVGHVSDMERIMDRGNAENAKLMVDRRTFYDSQRLRVATFLQSIGVLYTHYGGILMHETDPRAIYHILEHVTALIRDDRQIAYTGIVLNDVDEIRTASITLMNDEDQEPAEAEGKRKNEQSK